MNERFTHGPLQKNEYNISTANVFDQATLHFAFGWGIKEHADLATDAGYTGIELWPSHPRISHEIHSGTLDSTYKTKIRSAHQSPRTETPENVLVSFRNEFPNNKIAAVKHALSATPPMLLLPEITQSLQDLTQIRKLTGDIPFVMYKETPLEFHQQADIEKRLIQPDPDLSLAWNVQNTQDFLDQVEEKGFTGVCLDTTHLRRKNRETGQPSPLADWEKSIPILVKSGLLQEVHVAVGRTDPATADLIGEEKTIAELQDLLNGTRETESTAMLELLANNWRGPVVIEVLPSAIKKALHKEKAFLSRQDLKDSYKRIRSSLYAIFDK